MVAAAGSVAAVGAQRLRKRRRARQLVGAEDGTDEAVTERGRQRWVRVHARYTSAPAAARVTATAAAMEVAAAAGRAAVRLVVVATVAVVMAGDKVVQEAAQEVESRVVGCVSAGTLQL